MVLYDLLQDNMYKLEDYKYGLRQFIDTSLEGYISPISNKRSWQQEVQLLPSFTNFLP